MKSAENPRYKVLRDSLSGHCCFEATVVDTSVSFLGEPTSLCECFSVNDAEMIADKLNAGECENKGRQEQDAALRLALVTLDGVARGKYDGNAFDVCTTLRAVLAHCKDTERRKEALQQATDIAQDLGLYGDKP